MNLKSIFPELPNMYCGSVLSVEIENLQLLPYQQVLSSSEYIDASQLKLEQGTPFIETDHESVSTSSYFDQVPLSVGTTWKSHLVTTLKI